MSRGDLWFWLALAVVWFSTAGLRPLLEPDEARYAEIPREMWVGGDWVIPQLNGVDYFEKPPLLYWGTALVYSLVGVNEWSARLWPLALSFLALPLTAALARRIHGTPEAGLAAAATLAASPMYALVGQLNLLDGAFTTWLCAAIFAFTAAQCEKRSGAARALMLGAWAALALAVLTKGIAAPVLAGGALVVYSLATRDFSPWRRLHLLPGLAIFLALALPWFWLVARRDPAYLQFFFVHEHLQRFFTTEHGRWHPFWYFLPVLAAALLPWLWLLPAALRAPFARAWDAPGFRPGVFLALFSALVLAFFSASDSKLAPYIFPCIPALAVLLAPQVIERRRSVGIALDVTAALLAFGAGGLLVVPAWRSGPTALPAALVGWCAVAAGLALAVPLARRWLHADLSGPLRYAPLALGALVGWQALLTAYPALPPPRTAKPLVAAAAPEIRAGTRLYSVSQYRQSVPPYLGRTLRLVHFQGELAFGIARDPDAFVPTLDAFMTEWDAQQDAVAFMDRKQHARLVARGLPGRIIAQDERSVVIARR